MVKQSARTRRSIFSMQNQKHTADLDIRNRHVAGVQPPPVLLVGLQHPPYIQRLGLSPSTLDGTLPPLPVDAIA